MTNKKSIPVCFISYIFPPLNAGGSVRSKNFVKYLGRLGYTCHVLTVRLPQNHSDKTLKDQLGFSEETTLHRAFSLDPFRAMRSLSGEMKETPWQKILRWISSFLFVPDRQVLWLPFAVIEGIKVVKNCRCEVIYSTFGPASNHLAALVLKWLTKKPWIADFRDPWMANRNFKFVTPLHRGLHRLLEGLTVRFADKVIAVNDYILKSLSCRPQAAGKLAILPHGFDVELLDKYKDLGDRAGKKKFTIGYMGSFFKGRSPEYFFKGVEKLLSSGKIDPSDFRIVFMSNLNKNAVARPPLREVLEMLDLSSHAEAVKRMTDSTVLLLIVEEGLKEQILNVKLFDYMGMGKPILALVPWDSATAAYLKPSGLGTFADPSGIDDIAQKIFWLYQSWKQGQLIPGPDCGYISQFEAGKITERLSLLIEELRRPSSAATLSQ